MKKDTMLQLYDLVLKICNDMPDDPNTHTIKRNNYASEILKLIGISPRAEIQEIPVMWDNQVVISFTIGPEIYNAEKNSREGLYFNLVVGESAYNRNEIICDLEFDESFSQVIKTQVPYDNDSEMGYHLFKVRYTKSELGIRGKE